MDDPCLEICLPKIIEPQECGSVLFSLCPSVLIRVSCNVRVPIIFEGDLAHIAASHLKENDRVYVGGKLSASLPHLNANQVQASVQVLAHCLNFIDESVQTAKSSVLYKQEKATRNVSDRVNKDESDLSSWTDLLENPKQWWDNRDKKCNRSVSQKYPDFIHKDDRRGVWLNRAPRSVLIELEGLQFDVQIKNSTEVEQFKGAKKDGDSASWRDLIDNSEQWKDYRNSKLNGLVNPRYPDFKHKDGSLALWLSSAPQWVSLQLEGLKFDGGFKKPKAVKANKDELWKDLVEHPEKWWDNRLGKLKENSPDFKHKETGEGLWLRSSPTWVLSKLPPPKSKQDSSFGKRDTLLS
ncbi:protein OSB3, chloroplastic/mitochondrial [Morus notabilis]|uniref:protein OSB3, chloroplastic/mitochondrial n=1 Tax=Morus notabilis TaxID=981085 RepID=UPI000CED3327|nr:protein OSB3, chloroplastic/mitochondrial [Morus notabilis]